MQLVSLTEVDEDVVALRALEHFAALGRSRIARNHLQLDIEVSAMQPRESRTAMKLSAVTFSAT